MTHYLMTNGCKFLFAWRLVSTLKLADALCLALDRRTLSDSCVIDGSSPVPADELHGSPCAAEEEAEEQGLVADERPLAPAHQAQILQSLHHVKMPVDIKVFETCLRSRASANLTTPEELGAAPVH